MRTTDAQVRKLMNEMTKHGQVGLASIRAGMDRKTARKYVREEKLPSELVGPRTYRTRTDPFAQDWAWVEEQLKASPTLEAKTLFEALCERRPEAYEEGQLRTLQRHVKHWRAESGPDKEVFFPQQHRPGEAAQTDFTCGTELGITILGVAFAHMLCHFVLPYSNWQWATVCASESIAAIKRGVQAALFRLGRHPTWHQTDNSTAATHRIGPGSRDFNDDYVAAMTHFGMKPRTTAIGEKEENGDVEAGNGALKRRLEQALLLRGERDFESVEIYESWMQGVCAKANAGRTKKVSEELAVMEVVDVSRLPEHIEIDVTFTARRTIRVAHNAYSAPSRLIHETLRVHLYERRIDVHYGPVEELVTSASRTVARVRQARRQDRDEHDVVDAESTRICASRHWPWRAISPYARRCLAMASSRMKRNSGSALAKAMSVP